MRSWEKVILKYTDRIDTVLPDETVKGEPFWALMEIREGKNTGNFHSIGKRAGNTMIMLFPQKQMADWAAIELSKHATGFQVRGISLAHLRVLFGLYEEGFPIEFIVAASQLNKKGELMGSPMTPYHIREALGLDHPQGAR